MNTFFNIRYEFDRSAVSHAINQQCKTPGSDYICVADGVILDNVNRNPEYLKVVNGGMFSICDSSYVPLYIKWIYGVRYNQYCGSQILEDIVKSRKYRMAFLGASQDVLDGLRTNLSKLNPDVANMLFVELPFLNVEEFNYPQIAKEIENDGADIIWIALGAPKQEWFMHFLKPHLSHGVMIAVGAAFKFFSGVDTKRAPKWMIDFHLEFVHRLFKEPKKQFFRCFHIIRTLPSLILNEWRIKNG